LQHDEFFKRTSTVAPSHFNVVELTFYDEFDPLADAGGNLVAGNAEVGAHLLPGYVLHPGTIVNPVLFIKNKRLFISSEGFLCP
jgi:hypothetical protein